MSTAEQLGPEPNKSFDLQRVTNPDGSYNPSLAIILEFGRKVTTEESDDHDELHDLQERLHRLEARGGDQDRGLTPPKVS